MIKYLFLVYVLFKTYLLFITVITDKTIKIKQYLSLIKFLK